MSVVSHYLHNGINRAQRTNNVSIIGLMQKFQLHPRTKKIVCGSEIQTWAWDQLTKDPISKKFAKFSDSLTRIVQYNAVCEITREFRSAWQHFSLLRLLWGTFNLKIYRSFDARVVKNTGSFFSLKMNNRYFMSPSRKDKFSDHSGMRNVYTVIWNCRKTKLKLDFFFWATALVTWTLRVGCPARTYRCYWNNSNAYPIWN